MRAIRLTLTLAIVVVLFPVGAASAARQCFDEGHTFERRSMRGFLDGDRIADTVWVGARQPDGRCRYFVFARTDDGTSRVRIPAGDKLSRASLRDAARPIALVRLDGFRGREIAVKLLEGASVRPFGFFTMRRGRIVRMEIGATAPPLAAPDMFAFGGGLALMFGTDCAYRLAPRTVVFSTASQTNEASKYRVERRWYQVQGTDLVRTSRPTQTDVVGLRHLKERFPEFRNGGLLPRCDGRVLDPRQA
jgi:hypothetical protein